VPVQKSAAKVQIFRAKKEKAKTVFNVWSSGGKRRGLDWVVNYSNSAKMSPVLNPISQNVTVFPGFSVETTSFGALVRKLILWQRIESRKK